MTTAKKAIRYALILWAVCRSDGPMTQEQICDAIRAFTPDDYRHVAALADHLEAEGIVT